MSEFAAAIDELSAYVDDEILSDAGVIEYPDPEGNAATTDPDTFEVIAGAPAWVEWWAGPCSVAPSAPRRIDDSAQTLEVTDVRVRIPRSAPAAAIPAGARFRCTASANPAVAGLVGVDVVEQRRATFAAARFIRCRTEERRA